MVKTPRNRRVSSITRELLTKSRESAMAAVQIFNNPLITFKSEIFIVLMIIAWTYLLHAYYRKHNIEYRYHKQPKRRRIFEKTKSGRHKYWELERCLKCQQSPIDKNTTNNLRFLIGIRHEIEHQMTSQLDSSLCTKFQACCLNYNHYIKKFFGEGYGIDKHLAFSLQFSSITSEQAATLPKPDEMHSQIKAFINKFENEMPEEEFNSPRFAYRVLFFAKTANRKGQADQVIEYVKADSTLATDVNKAYAVIKETERPKYLPSGIVRMMKEEGYTKFNMHSHTNLWKRTDAKNPGKGFGVAVQNTWYWYENWIDDVRKHCQENAVKYGAKA